MKRFTRLWLGAGFLCAITTFAPLSYAKDTPLNVVATFSILGDMVKSVGGDRVQITTLVGPDSDTHAYHPTPSDAKTILKADILFVNGWGFEGWLDRLVDASGYKGTLITTTQGIDGLPFEHEDEHEDGHKDEHEDKHEDGHKDEHEDKHEGKHADAHGHHHGDTDPHAWQSLAHAKTYIQNITRALLAADPEGQAVYTQNRDAYLKQLSDLEVLVTKTLDTLPKERRTVVTSHDAFSYFADSYQLKFLAPQGLNPEAEASARNVAALIEQIRAENITALFLENIVSPRLLKQIAAESSVKVGGTLYADGLSKPDGDAGTYLKMMKHNIITVYQTLKPE